MFHHPAQPPSAHDVVVKLIGLTIFAVGFLVVLALRSPLPP